MSLEISAAQCLPVEWNVGDESFPTYFGAQKVLYSRQRPRHRSLYFAAPAEQARPAGGHPSDSQRLAAYGPSREGAQRKKDEAETPVLALFGYLPQRAQSVGRGESRNRNRSFTLESVLERRRRS